jgi:hypothetical protein
MATLQIESVFPTLTPEQKLVGWRREFCIGLLGDGAARVFVRAVPKSSFKATELQRAILFHRLDPRFTDLTGCVGALQADLKALADTSRRVPSDKAHLFATVEYDRAAWERVEQGIERWSKR